MPENLKSLVDQLPDADARGMYATEMDKEKIERVLAEILAGGRASVAGLVAMLVPPGEGDDGKAHYALHCLGNYILQRKDENARRQYSETLAGELATRPKAVRAFLCQELQWFGRREAVAALGQLLTDEDLVEPAVMALTAIRDGAAEQLRAALPKVKGKCLLNVVHGLAAVADLQAADVFREALGNEDREVRLAAGAGLARVGDEPAGRLLIEAAERAEGWERIEQTKHCLVLAERLAAADKKDAAAKVYQHFAASRRDPSERYIVELSQKALAGLQ